MSTTVRSPLVSGEVGEPKDFSWLDLEEFSEVLEETPNPGLRKVKSAASAKTGALKLNNNKFSSWNNFLDVVTHIMPEGQASGLHWIDLSFNNLRTIDDAILEFQNIGSLYLHANEIPSMKMIDKLAKLPNLKSLTLHGNPVETRIKERSKYRMYIISRLPNLRKLDFTPVTKEDRENAAVWAECTRRGVGGRA